MQVANTILQQLGGNRFIAMTGAKNFVGSANALHFSLGRGAKQGINKIRISLNSDDTYDIEFFKARGVELQLVGIQPMVYAENLAYYFSNATGFDTRL